MLVIYARNVNDAYIQGLNYLHQHGIDEETRGGPCRVMPVPVTTIYSRPMQRVLWDAQRNANPFFHLAESLWMLAGRNDATWLDKFVGDFSSRFAEEGGLQHGAYGYRWRNHFDMEGGGYPFLPDQLNTLVALLKQNPSDRRAVLAMWDPAADLAAKKKDIPCNTHVYFRIHPDPEIRSSGSGVIVPSVLDMTVCCRSNDLVWGAYGANAVHFSILQEYMARRIGVQIGAYFQISNNYHAYKATLPTEWTKEVDLYQVGVGPTPIVTHPDQFDNDLKLFFDTYDDEKGAKLYNPFLYEIARPMFKLYERRRELTQADLAVWGNERTHSDWGIATVQWLDRWLAKRSKG